jgi:hypothetical protein
MSKPRNPRYFPRMKVRGAQRRRQAPLQRMAGAFDQLSAAALSASDAFTALVAEFKLEEPARQ